MLTATRKADRAEMVRQLQELATRVGARVDLTAEGSNAFYTRGFHITLNRDGLNASLGVDGGGRNEKNGDYVVSWHMDTDCDKRLSSHFEVLCGHDSVNRYHRRKATGVLRTFPFVLLHLRQCFATLADGTAYEQPQLERVEP